MSDKSLAELSRDMMAAAEALNEADKRRNVLLNQVVRGERVLDRDDHEHLMASNRAIGGLLRGVSVGRDVRVIPAGPGARDADGHEQWGSGVGDLPVRLRRLYELLCLAVYGMDSSRSGNGISSRGADDNVRAGNEGVNTWRVDSGKSRTNRGARRGVGKFGSGRVLVKNDKAYHYKRNVDKKLRRIASDIEYWLSHEASMEDHGSKAKGSDGQGSRLAGRRICSSCKKVGEDDWRHCPRCGASMQKAS